ncbi:hypothetical protein [Brevundimonas subvibrioides]|uniref:hypothetical protein n=1 Tax=Brevundimonas subvibrioides TaxID=74313 RepID=UPI0022B4F8F7|nr:hypothetical protein [Brevundimonas subvibrioides]
MEKLANLEALPPFGFTVSNPDFRDVGSTCIAERRAIEMLDEGASRTSFMTFGDRGRMECVSAEGSVLFGPIDQTVRGTP